MNRLLFKRRGAGFGTIAVIGAMVMLSIGPAARADVLFGESEGYAVDIDFDVTVLSTQLDKAVPSSGTGGSPYNESNFLGNVITTGAVEVLSETGNSTATSDVDGLPGTRTVTASGDLTFVSVESYLSIVTGYADLVRAEATVAGDFGAFTRTGVTTLTGLAINVNGTDLVIPVSPGPNFVLFDFAGLTIVLNEQIQSGNGINDAGIAVNAIHVFADNVAGFANGELIFGHANAYAAGIAASAVIPEPTSAGLVLMGVGMMVLRRKRREAF